MCSDKWTWPQWTSEKYRLDETGSAPATVFFLFPQKRENLPNLTYFDFISIVCSHSGQFAFKRFLCSFYIGCSLMLFYNSQHIITTFPFSAQHGFDRKSFLRVPQMVGYYVIGGLMSSRICCSMRLQQKEK